MIENEDSVVTSLNELRKLKNERISRQTQSRSVVSASAVALVEDPLADQLTPPPMQGISAVVSAVEQKAVFAAPAANHFASQAAFDHAPVVQAPPVVQVKTSYKAAVVVALLLGGAGAAGYFKLQQDTQALLSAKDATIRSAEDARMRSVETAAKSEQLSKANLRQCEDKLKASLASAAAAAAPTAPAAAAAVAPVVEKKPQKPSVAAKASRGGRHVAARPARQTAQAAPAAVEKEAKQKSGDVPTIAKKKKVDNDPLAGLGKL